MARAEGYDGFKVLEMTQANEIPREWKVAGHPKERELKTEPRIFIIMVPDMRCYFCASEKNVANSFFNYFTQQSMSSSESDLNQRLLRGTKPTICEGSPIKIVMNIDFSS